MKIKFKIVLLLTVFTGMLYGQALKHPWWVTDGGGGKSTGSTLTLSSSVGQAGAQVMTGGSFTMEGGYIPGLRLFGGTMMSTPVSMQVGWCLLSVPLVSGDMRAVTLYPAGVSPAWFYQPGGYVMMDTLKVGDAYWIKFPSPQSYSIVGTAVAQETLQVYVGWNMVGGLSYQILTSMITPVPPVIITTPFFRYQPGVGYVPSDTLQPGLGYWVKVNQFGKIVLKTSSNVPANKPKIATGQTGESSTEGLSSLVVKDQSGKERKLFYSSVQKEIDLSKFELPPTPPADIFDVRFSSQRYAEAVSASKGSKQEFPLRINAGEYPLTLSWDESAAEGGNVVLEVRYAGENPKQYQVMGKGSVTIREENFVGAKLVISPKAAIVLPKEYALYQNYPNPFNPTTKIRYDLPKDSKVSLKVFNLLGQEVATLRDGMEEAGFKSVEWNTTNNTGEGVGSGVYFYRLQADDFSMVRKLMLVR